MTETVALIGVGAMGKAFLSRLQASGRHVQAFDVTPPACEAAGQMGAVVATSPAAAASGAKYIHVLVATDEQVLQAMLGDIGVLAGAAPGSVIFLHSTSLPDTSRKVAAAAEARNIHVLDAPITAVPRRILAGEGMFLVGGSKEVVDEVRSYLLLLGKTVLHFGPLGAGNVAKLAKNLYNASERVLLSEILNLAEAGGLDLHQFLDMLVAAHDRPAVAEWADNFTIVNGHAVHRPTTNLFGKDVAQAVTLSQSLGLDAPLTDGVGRTAQLWLRNWGQVPRA